MQSVILVTTVNSFSDFRNRSNVGLGLDGVVRVTTGSHYGTGVLLYDGAAVLTAAHLFTSDTSTTSVIFETKNGTQTIKAKQVLIHSDFNVENSTSD